MYNEKLNDYLFEAVRDGNSKKVKYLLEIGASVLALKDGKTILEEAKEVNQEEIVSSIEQELVKEFEKTIKNDKVNEVIKVLNRINGGEILVSEVNALELGQKLVVAVDKGDIIESYKLINKGADVNFLSLYGNNPLILACDKGNGFHIIVKKLIERGADIEKGYRNGRTPLIVSVEHNSVEIVDILLEAGANVNALTYMNKTPLFIAAEREEEVIMKKLLNYNPELEVKCGDYGYTPLMMASIKGNVNCVKMLIEKGADVEAVNFNGKSVISLAKRDVKKILREEIEKKREKEGIVVEKKSLLSRMFGGR